MIKAKAEKKKSCIWGLKYFHDACIPCTSTIIGLLLVRQHHVPIVFIQPQQKVLFLHYLTVCPHDLLKESIIWAFKDLLFFSMSEDIFFCAVIYDYLNKDPLHIVIVSHWDQLSQRTVWGLIRDFYKVLESETLGWCLSKPCFVNKSFFRWIWCMQGQHHGWFFPRNT